MLRNILLIACLVSRPAFADCFGEDSTHLVLERELIDFQDGHWLVAIIRQIQGKEADGSNEFFIDGVEFTLFTPIDYPCGKPLLDYSMQGVDTGHVNKIDYPWLKGIDLTGMMLGGSGNGLSHSIFSYGDEKLAAAGIDWKDLAKHQTGLQHTNMGGIYVGQLGPGHGNGLVMWEADWTDGAHYDPHPFDVYYFSWDGRSFTLSQHINTGSKYDPEAAKPEFLGLPAGSELPRLQFPYTFHTMTR